MRTAIACVAGLCLAAAAGAQERPPDVPSGDGTLAGRVVHEQRADAGAGASVILYSLSPGGEPGLRRTLTDERGAFRFEGISADPAMVYLVGTRVGGVPFGARVTFAAGETTREVEIQVRDPSRRTQDVTLLEGQIRFRRGCTHLRVQHLQSLRNDTQQVVYVPPDARQGVQPVLDLLLPESATEIETPAGDALEGFDRQGRRLRYWGPVYPGESRLEFGYGVPLARESQLRIGFPKGSAPLRVFAPAAGPRVSGETLHADGEVAIPDGFQRALRADAVAAGGELAMAVALDEAAPAEAVRVPEARLWLELDDAALDVSEQYELQVDAKDALDSASDAPLLCLELPPQAHDLRFATASLDMGLSRDPEGVLAVYGPIPPGHSSLSLRYRLPAKPGTIDFARRFSRDVSLLTLLVADTGLVPRAERLHLRRPIRTEDRAYLHLEGFGIEAGETVSVELEPLRERHPLPAPAASGFVLLAGLSAVLFLVAPLRSGTEPEPAAAQADVSPERQAVYQAIEALDEDFETGKLSPEDHARMREELRGRAVSLLHGERERERSTSAERAAATPPFCSQCGAATGEGHRFCSQCGAPLAIRSPG